MKAFTIGAFSIAPGTRQTIELPISVMANHIPISLPVHVIHGARPGLVLFISVVVARGELGQKSGKGFFEWPQRTAA